MASAGYVNERPILGCRFRALNDRLWVLSEDEVFQQTCVMRS